MMDLLTAEDRLQELVRLAMKSGCGVSRGVVSQGDFATMWQAARAMGIVQRDGNTPSAPTELRYWFYNGAVKITVSASPWCPDGQAGVA